jgi:hypothetical protein
MGLVDAFGNRMMRALVSVGVALTVSMLGAWGASAASITDYTLLVIGESSGTGGNDSIWAYTSLSAAPVELAEVPTPQPFYVNGLATDASRNRLLMVDDGDSGFGNGTPCTSTISRGPARSPSSGTSARSIRWSPARPAAAGTRASTTTGTTRAEAPPRG